MIAPSTSNRAKLVVDARNKVDAWDEPTFARVRAIGLRFHPEAVDYLFANGLTASHSVQAVQGVRALLLRLETLEKGTDPQRKAVVTQDRDFIAKLADRGITRAVRDEMMQACELAMSPEAAQSTTPNLEARRQKLVELRAWYDEWATATRTVVKKRAHLIRLGLAKRQVRDHGTVDETPTAPTDAPVPGMTPTK